MSAIGRPKVVSRKLLIGLYPRHADFIETLASEVGCTQVEVIREALDRLMASQSLGVTASRRRSK